MPNLPPIRPIIAFEAAARLGSFKRAAEELAISASAISHNIAILEDFLGRKLFERQARNLRLTADGYKYSVLIGQVTQTLQWATQEVKAGAEPETLNVQSHPTFAGTWLAPRIRRFSENNPDIDIRLKTSFSPVEAMSEEADLAFTYVEMAPAGCSEQVVLNESIIPLVEPNYWQGLPGKTIADKLKSAVLLHSDRNLLGWKTWLEQREIAHPRSSRGPRFDRGQIALDIAASGWGVALESSAFAEGYLQRGALIPPFPKSEVQLFTRAHKLIIPFGIASRDVVQRFSAYILSEGLSTSETLKQQNL